jgi:hypothetical protein
MKKAALASARPLPQKKDLRGFGNLGDLVISPYSVGEVLTTEADDLPYEKRDSFEKLRTGSLPSAQGDD